MCLYIKPRQVVKTAKNSIVCYKSVDMSTRALPTGVAYELRSTNKGYFKWTSGNIHTSNLTKSGGSIHEGLHTYKELDGALSDSGTVILVCKIPKGAEYYEGTHNGTAAGYASDKLFVVEIRLKSNVVLDAAVKKNNVVFQTAINKAFKEIRKQHKIIKSLLS